MTRLTVHLSLALLCMGTQSALQAAPIRAVVNANNSQIVESIAPSGAPTLSVIPGSILPLVDQFSPISHTHSTNYNNWSAQLAKQVKVDSKQRDLSYSGKLTAIDQQTGHFTLAINDVLLSLPINDFYLIPLKSVNHKKTDVSQSYPAKISYQTKDLSWSAKRTLIIKENDISLINSAQLHNSSIYPIELSESLLHYSPTNTIRNKAQTSLMRLSDANTPSYTDNEITYPLDKIHLKPNTDTLLKLASLQAKIDHKQQTASVFSSSNSRSELALNFHNTLSFTLSQDALPGQYQTFWMRNGLLIPSNVTNIPSARAQQQINITTNKSLDLTGHLTLLSSSSQSGITTQTWEVSISNHSDADLAYSISHQMQGIINNVKGQNTSKKTVNSVKIEGVVKSKSSAKYNYQVQLNE